VQDHDRGLIVGEVTWGKGLVQTVYTVRDTGLALTTARYYTPSGRSIQRDYESFIDYVTHRNGTAADDESAPIYETDAGRTVLGGGGITPDISVAGRPLSENLARLYGNSAFFRFAIELLQNVPEEDKAQFARQFTVDQEVLDRFWDWVRTQEILQPSAVEELRQSEQDVFDVKAGYRVALDNDEQFLAALENLPEAEDFWLTWSAANNDN
ncbi:MAG: S41 family peptidase, partial [Acidobacteriota bacterium]